MEFVNDDVISFVNKLKSQEGKNIWLVGGGELLHSFIQGKLVDELILTVAPTLIGKGVPLFREGDYQLDLSLKSLRNFNQFVELHYEVKILTGQIVQHERKDKIIDYSLTLLYL